MGFIGLSSLPTIYSNTGALSESDKYQLEEGTGDVYLGRWGSWVYGGAGVGTESCGRKGVDVAKVIDVE